MSFSDPPREPRAARRARPRLSLKMQAIGFLSRREHSRQELRAKLLESLRKRAREEAALAAATEKAAEELAQALREQPSNGIDDAFAPREPAPKQATASAGARVSASVRARAPRAGAGEDARTSRPGTGERVRGLPLVDDLESNIDHDAATDAPREPRSRRAARATNRAALDTLTLGNGAALPARLRANLAVTASSEEASIEAGALEAASGDASSAASDDAPADADLERSDPEAAVERLLDWLVANKYLSDVRFVESRVNARSRKQGALRIKLELSRHGLALEPEQAAALRETEFARAQALWQRKFGEVAAEPRERAKQARFLASRGFAADVVRRIVGGLDED